MSKSTKGPWLFRGKSDSVHEACDTHPYGKTIFQFRGEGDELPSDADLSLILAAPDLYASAWEALGVLTGIRDDAMSRNNREAMVDEAIASIEKSIARARGEA